MHIHSRCLLAAVWSLFIGISPLAQADEVADRAALEAATQAWIKAYNSRDADALVALSTPDVVLLDPSLPPVSGREAARGAWAQALAAATGQITNATKEAVIAGDVAWRIGALAQKLPNGNDVSRGQSLEIWKRVNGAWKIHRQMTSRLLAQPKPRRLPSEPLLDAPN